MDSFKKDTNSESETKTNDPLDSTTNPGDNEIKEDNLILKEENCIIKDNLHLKEDNCLIKDDLQVKEAIHNLDDLVKGKKMVFIGENEELHGLPDPKEVEAYKRVKSFLEARFELAAFLFDKG